MTQVAVTEVCFKTETLEAINTLSTAYQRISVREGSKQQSKLLEKIEEVMLELLEGSVSSTLYVKIPPEIVSNAQSMDSEEYRILKELETRLNTNLRNLQK